jgi:ParB-like chromosome segregation protein Spo0J
MTDTTNPTAKPATITIKPADPGIPDFLNRQLNHEYPLHPLTAMFPLMEAKEFASLVADIEANGLIEPITLKDGAILDGRNKYSACKTARYQFKAENFVELPKDQDPLVFVISKNMQRRHLTAEQKREVIRQLLDKKPNASSRAIASITRCSHHTVESVRNEAAPKIPETPPKSGSPLLPAPTGQSAQLVEKRVGQDGKKRKPPTKTKASETKDKKKQIDGFIAEWATLNVWQQTYFVRTYKDDLAEIIAEIDALAGDPEAIAGQTEEDAEQVATA